MERGARCGARAVLIRANAEDTLLRLDGRTSHQSVIDLPFNVVAPEKGRRKDGKHPSEVARGTRVRCPKAGYSEYTQLCGSYTT